MSGHATPSVFERYRLARRYAAGDCPVALAKGAGVSEMCLLGYHTKSKELKAEVERIGEFLATREKQVGSITDPALEMRLLAYAKAELPRRVQAKEISEEAMRLGATAEQAYGRKKAMLFLQRHAVDLGQPEAGGRALGGGGAPTAMDVVLAGPAAAHLPTPATFPEAPPSLPFTPHQGMPLLPVDAGHFMPHLGFTSGHTALHGTGLTPERAAMRQEQPFCSPERTPPPPPSFSTQRIAQSLFDGHEQQHWPQHHYQPQSVLVASGSPAVTSPWGLSSLAPTVMAMATQTHQQATGPRTLYSAAEVVGQAIGRGGVLALGCSVGGGHVTLLGCSLTPRGPAAPPGQAMQLTQLEGGGHAVETREALQVAFSLLRRYPGVVGLLGGQELRGVGEVEAWLAEQVVRAQVGFLDTQLSGSSLGLPLFLQLLRDLTGTPLPLVAATGELTLGGQVLGVWGMGLKVLGTRPFVDNIKALIYPADNTVDVAQCEQYLPMPRNMVLHGVPSLEDAMGVVGGLMEGGQGEAMKGVMMDPVGRYGCCFTPMGASLIRVEVLLLRGRGDLVITGNLDPIAQEAVRVSVHHFLTCLPLHEARAVDGRLVWGEGEGALMDVHLHLAPLCLAKSGASIQAAVVCALAKACLPTPAILPHMADQPHLVAIGALTPDGALGRVELQGLGHVTVGSYKESAWGEVTALKDPALQPSFLVLTHPDVVTLIKRSASKSAKATYSAAGSKRDLVARVCEQHGLEYAMPPAPAAAAPVLGTSAFGPGEFGSSLGMYVPGAVSEEELGTLRGLCQALATPSERISRQAASTTPTLTSFNETTSQKWVAGMRPRPIPAYAYQAVCKDTTGQAGLGVFGRTHPAANAPQVPDGVTQILERIEGQIRAEGGLKGLQLWAVTANWQPPGTFHSPHYDPPTYHAIVGVTGYGSATLRLHSGHDTKVVAEQLLEPGSLYVLEGQAVQACKHSVSEPSNSEAEKDDKSGLEGRWAMVLRYVAEETAAHWMAEGVKLQLLEAADRQGLEEEKKDEQGEADGPRGRGRGRGKKGTSRGKKGISGGK